jgi:preprotein translocase subunit SecF
LTLFALFILGGGVIRPFAFTLIVGFISGVYSTIFIASPVILLWEKSARRKQ